MSPSTPPRAAARSRVRFDRRQVAALLAILLIGSVATIAAFLTIRDVEAARDRDWGERAATLIEHQVDEGGLALLGAGGLFAGSDEVTEEEFRAYADGPLRGTATVGLAWMPRVTEAGRAAFERANGLTMLDARTPSPSSLADFHRAAARPVHFPYLFIARSSGTDVIAGLRGLDVLGFPGQAEALGDAARWGRPALAAALDTRQGPMVAMYAPVGGRGAGGRATELRGYVYAAYMLEDLLRPARDILPPGSTLQLRDDGQGLHAPAAGAGAEVAVAVAGRRWTLGVDVPAGPTAAAAAPGTLATTLLVVGVVGLLFAQGNRREDASRRAAAEQAALRRVATAAASAPEDVVALVAAEAAQLLDADEGVVCRFADGLAVPVGAWGILGIEDLPDGIDLGSGGAMAAVRRTGAAVRFDDYAALSDDDPVVASGWTHVIGSAVAAPVRLGDGVWGAVLVARAERRAFPDGTESRLARFADLAAAAISSAEARSELALRATTDPLTGLANRRAFEDRLDAETARAGRTGGYFAVAMIDIDRFKRVNDVFGHAAGDRVLVELARRLRSIARPQDLVARIGGEELAWIMTETDIDGAFEAAERGRRLIRATPFEGVGTVTVSAGVCDLRSAPPAGGLMRGADLALYWAKSHGRDRTGRHERDGTSGDPALSRAVRA